LPDYLPLILEFMAVVPRARWSAPITKSLKGLRTLVERLEPASAAYAGLLAPLSELYGAQDRERAAPALE
jgi:nitrate reductase delta subunit